MINKTRFIFSTVSARLIILLLLSVVLLTAAAGCDFLQDDVEVYDLTVHIDIDESELREEIDVEDFEVEKGGTPLDQSRYDFWFDNGSIKGEIKNLQGRVTLTLSHPMLGAGGRRVGPAHADDYTVFNLPDLRTVIDFELEQIPLHEYINVPGQEDVYFYKLRLHDELEQLDRLDWVETAVFLDSNEEILSEKKIGHDFYLLADPDTDAQVAEAELALLNPDRTIQARGEFTVSENVLPEEDAEEQEPDLTVALNYEDGSQLSSPAAVQGRENYLNRVKLYDGDDILVEHESDTDDPIYENFVEYDEGIEFDNERLMTDGLPGSYLTVAGVVTDMSVLLQPDGGRRFREMVDSKMDKHNHDFDEMDLYVKFDNTEHQDLLDLADVDPDEVWETLEEILTDVDGSWQREKFAGLEFTYDMGQVVEDEAEVTYFEVVVNEVYGYPQARSFTLGDGSSGYDNTSQELGAMLRQTTEPDNDEMYIYALGSAPDGYDPGPRYISSADELYDALYDNPQARVILTQDIDMNNLSQEHWTPVGSRNRPFAGKLDGNDYEINNLTIDYGGSDAGLFRYLGEDATVEDVYLHGEIDVSGRNYVGVVAGRNQGTIRNVRLRSADVSGDEYAGALVGENKSGGEIINSPLGIFTDDDSIDVSVEHDYAGGIAGINTGDIRFSELRRDELYTDGYLEEIEDAVISIGSVASENEGKNIGGLVGYNSGDAENGNDRGVIDMDGLKTAAGEVSGGREVGGLAGRNSGRIIDGWMVVENSVVAEGDNVGGFVGLHEFIDDPTESQLINMRAGTEDELVEVEGYNSVGGLVGESWADIEWNDDVAEPESYFDVEGEHFNIGGVIGHMNYGTIKIDGVDKKLMDGSDVRSTGETGRFGRVIGRIDDRDAGYVIDVDEDIDHLGFEINFDLSDEPEEPEASDPYDNVGYGPSPWAQ